MKIITYSLNQKPKLTFWQKLKKRFKQLPKTGTILTWLFRLAAIGIFSAAVLFTYYSSSLPDPNKLIQRNVAESTKIYASDNSLLYEIHGEAKRTLINLDQISDDLKNATVAVEDKDFYTHSGISIRGLARSLFIDIITLKKSQGGSTITQQFVKNALLTKEKALSRKLKEIILSIELEARFSKDDILKLYLNEIPYGRNAYGIEAASEAYFGKSANEINLAESAYLAALPQAPTFYNPFGPNRESLDNRKNTILSLMKDQGYITTEQFEQAKNLKVEFKPIQTTIKAPHFVLYVQDYLAKKYGEKTLEEGGLKVYTTLDPKLQEIAEKAVKTGAERNTKNYDGYNAALVAMNPKNGQILAMVGSKDYFGTSLPEGCTPGKDCKFEPNVNVATSQRQPGSSFKPYAYVTSFTKDFGYSPASLLMDVTTNFGTFGGKSYIPKNYNLKQNGPVSIRQALAGSLNIPAVKILDLVGVERVAQTARDLGITSPLANCGLSLVLGGCEVKLIDHVNAYATLANQGKKNEKTPIIKIEDKDGNTLESFEQKETQVIDPEAVYQLVNIMSDNNARSYVFTSNSPLTLGKRPVAAKTGTTQNWHDGWTLGFTPSLVAGVWAGNNDGSLMKAGKSDGVVVAAPIWNEFMKEALKDTPIENFEVPSGIQKIIVDSVSGKLPTEYSPDTKYEIFASYSIPKDSDNVHIAVKIDTTTGLKATELTPPENISYKVYTVFHSERPGNKLWEDPVRKWMEANNLVYPDETISQTPPNQNPTNGPQVDILEPKEGSVITKLPLTLTLSSNPEQNISRIDVLLDGDRIQSLNPPNNSLQITKNLEDGEHTISIHSVDAQGNTSDNSTTFTIASKQILTLLEPVVLDANSIELTAESPLKLTNASFYYEQNKQMKQIGTANIYQGVNGDYRYTYLWSNLPKAGEYNIFIQSNKEKSQTIKLTIPEKTTQ